MDFLGNDVSFVVLVLFGMFAVGVHSHNQYGKRVPDGDGTGGDGADKHHFLDSLSLRALGERHSYLRGFLFYVAVNELIYLTLSFSSLILQQSVHLIGQQKMVGALTADSHINPLYPILASSVLIVASQMKPLSDVENALRRMAHAFAGIPRTLFDVQQRIRAQTFNELIDPKADEEQSGALHELVRNAEQRAGEVEQAAKRAGMPDDERSTLKKSLTKMQCLYGWTLGYHGEKIWVDERTMPISEFFQSIKTEQRHLSETIATLVGARPPLAAGKPASLDRNALLEQWLDVALRCRALENRLSDVLGLMLINKPDADLSAYPTLRLLRSRVNRRDGKPEMNAFGMAVLQGALFAVASLLMYVIAERLIKDVIRAPDLQTVQPLMPASSEASAVSQIDLQTILDKDLVGWTSKWGGYINKSVQEVMEPALVFVISVGIALSMRALQRASRRWPARVIRQSVASNPAGTIRVARPPSVTNYLYIGGCAYLLTCAAVLLYRYLILVVGPAVSMSQSLSEAAQLVNFSTYIPEVFLVCGSAFVCVWFACAYLDLESWNDALWVHRSAFTMPVACGTLNLVAAMSTATIYTGWGLVGALLSPTIVYSAFFVCYARTMERYQEPEPVQVGIVEAFTIGRGRRRRARAASESKTAPRHEEAVS